MTVFIFKFSQINALKLSIISSNCSLPGNIFELYKNNDIIFEISSNRLGATVVLNSKNEIEGIITDGDLRRMLEKNQDIETLTAKDIMSIKPRTIAKDKLAIEAFYIMENNNITQMIVANDKKYIGMIHLHDILKEGIV